MAARTTAAGLQERSAVTKEASIMASNRWCRALRGSLVHLNCLNCVKRSNCDWSSGQSLAESTRGVGRGGRPEFSHRAVATPARRQHLAHPRMRIGAWLTSRYSRFIFAAARLANPLVALFRRGISSGPGASEGSGQGLDEQMRNQLGGNRAGSPKSTGTHLRVPGADRHHHVHRRPGTGCNKHP